MENGIDREKLDKELKKRGFDTGGLKNGKADAERILASLSKEDAEKVKNMLKDKDAVKKLLRSPGAEKILRDIISPD